MTLFAYVKSRWVSLGVLALCAAASTVCGDGQAREADTNEDKPVSAAARDALFAKLTASTWCDQNRVSAPQGLAPSSSRYAFAANGTYDWRRASDYVEGEGGGAWTFTATDAESGMILMDSGDALRFAFAADGSLLLEFEPLDPCAPLTITGDVKNLPRIKLSALFQQVTAHTWYRTSDVDLHSRPTSITYKPDGTYVAEYRYGECSETASWSLRDGELTREIPEPGCDSRQGGSAGKRLRYVAQIRGNDIVMETALYAGQPWTRGDASTLFESRHKTYEMAVSYPAVLRPGTAITLTFELTNIGTETLTLLNVSAEAKPSDGADVVIGGAALGNVAVLPGATQRFTLDVTPQGAGETAMTITLEAQGKRQRFDSNLRFVIDLGTT